MSECRPRGPECRIDSDGNVATWYLFDGLGSVVAELGGKPLQIDLTNGNVYTMVNNVYELVMNILEL